MADQHALADIQSRIEYPEINHISFGDIYEVLGKGFEDFRKKPSHMIFLCIFYPIFGLILVRLTFGYDIVPLLYPLIAGFALLGPLAAIGLYEISRRREAGQDVSWRHAFGIFYAPSIWSIVILGGLLMCIFFAWLLTADIIYASLFGTYQPNSPVDLLNRIVNTTEGHQLIVLGNSTGLLFAFSVFIISAISFPMLLDKHVSAATAVITSMRVIYHNPIAMLGWGLTIAVSLFLGALPFFIGLVVVMPVLGHATWHLYRKVVRF